MRDSKSVARGAARTSLFLAMSCVAFASPAFADDMGTVQSDVRDEDEIIVTGDGLDELESPKATAPLLDTPQTVTVISDQTLRRQNLLTLRDALSIVPGITFGAGEGGGGYGDSINLRGYSANNDITIDGVRDTAQYTRSDPFNLQQIEVYNGANTVFNGSGSVGGTINLVSKVPQAEDLTILQASVGTDNYYRGAVDVNQRVNDLIAVRLNAVYHHNDFPGRDVEEFERWGVAPSITFGIGSPTSLTLAYVHQRDNNVPVYGVPYVLNQINDGPLPGVNDSDYFGIVNLDDQEITVDRLTATFDHDFGEGLSIRNLTRWQRVRQDSQTSAPQGTFCLASGAQPITTTPTGTIGAGCPTGLAPGFYLPSGPRGLVRDQLNEFLYNQTDLRWVSGEQGRLRNTLVVGVSFYQEDYEILNAQLLRNPGGATPNPVLPPISLSNPDTVYTGPVNFVLTGISYGDSRNEAVYAFDTLEIGPMFEINAGVRLENVRTIFRADTFATPATGGAYTRGADQVNEDTLFSYRGGLVFHPIPNASLYVSYANSKTPTSASVRVGCTTNCEVRPESGRSYEIGGKIDLLDRRLQITAAVFRNERSNYRVASNDPIQPTLQVLDGRSRVDGIALGVSGNITPQWSIFANYTYLDGSVRQSVSDFCLDNPGTTGCGNSTALPDPQRGDRLIQTPRSSGSLFTTYTLPFGLQIGYGLTYQGGFATYQTNLLQRTQYLTDDYLTHRAFLAYALDNGLTFQLNVQNFTNERYFTGIRNNVNATTGIISGGWATPGEDRSAVFSVFYSF